MMCDFLHSINSVYVRFILAFLCFVDWLFSKKKKKKKKKANPELRPTHTNLLERDFLEDSQEKTLSFLLNCFEAKLFQLARS